MTLMELYTFGHNSTSKHTAESRDRASLPTRPLHAQQIKILWASWCDAVIAYQDDAGAWRVEYIGAGLTDAQKEHVRNSESVKRAVSGTEWKIDFFGSAMHDGLRGYVSSGPRHVESEVVLFGTDVEIEKGLPEMQSFSFKDTKLDAIRLTSNGSVLVSIANSSNTTESQIIHLKDLADLRQCLDTADFDPTPSPLTSLPISHFSTNSTTSTILATTGQVHTSTTDPRYPKSLGRPYSGTPAFEPVPYLSETRITRIASGGYMTAAVSSEGELFLWGQACPGAAGELSVLRHDSAPTGSPMPSPASGIYAEEEQDDYVKCLTVKINGKEASVYDVAIGHGHILVAAEVRTETGGTERAVFVAGGNSRGQLGCGPGTEFVREFVEVERLRDMEILGLVAAGWTMYVAASRGR